MMIDRKAFWISILLVLAMMAATVWRVSLLPDWHHVPAEGPDGGRMLPLFVVFGAPLQVLFVMAVLFVRGRLRSGAAEAVQPWRRHYSVTLIFVAVITTLAHGFNLARSLGFLHSIDRPALARGIMVLSGVFMMAAGNSLPKMPWLTARFRPLDPWQWNRHMRFAGKVTVALGLFFVVGMPLLPFRMLVPVSVGLALATIAASFWHRAKVRREPSPR